MKILSLDRLELGTSEYKSEALLLGQNFVSTCGLTNEYTVTCRGCCVTYKTGFSLDDWIYCSLYIYTFRDYRQLQRYRYSTHFQFTHALGFSVFTCRILATDLAQSHLHFNSHRKCSWHSIIAVLPFLLNHLRLPSTELDPILDYGSILPALRSVFCVLL
jgi:hypothetical protein